MSLSKREMSDAPSSVGAEEARCNFISHALDSKPCERRLKMSCFAARPYRRALMHADSKFRSARALTYSRSLDAGVKVFILLIESGLRPISGFTFQTLSPQI